MKQKSGPDKAPAEQVLKNIRRQTRRQYSAEEKIRIVLEGLRGEENISELCRREGIAAWKGAIAICVPGQAGVTLTRDGTDGTVPEADSLQSLNKRGWHKMAH